MVAPLPTRTIASRGQFDSSPDLEARRTKTCSRRSLKSARPVCVVLRRRCVPLRTHHQLIDWMAGWVGNGPDSQARGNGTELLRTRILQHDDQR